MISHLFIGVADFARALAFYRALMPVLGLQERFCEPERPWAGWLSCHLGPWTGQPADVERQIKTLPPAVMAPPGKLSGPLGLSMTSARPGA